MSIKAMWLASSTAQRSVFSSSKGELVQVLLDYGPEGNSALTAENLVARILQGCDDTADSVESGAKPLSGAGLGEEVLACWHDLRYRFEIIRCTQTTPLFRLMGRLNRVETPIV